MPGRKNAKKTRPPYGRFTDHAKAGATLQETQRMKNIRTALFFSFGFGFALATAWVTPPLQAQVAPPQPASNIVVQHDVPMKTRDGLTLYADIYRPNSASKLPVILMRTPYDKSVGWAVGPVYKMVPRGYVVIIQDVRGRYTSEGEWYPFRHEQTDGYDAVEWAAARPFCDGKVGMMGASYVGATQMLAAIARPPHLIAIAPNMTASNYHNGWTYQSGAFEQWFDQNWTSQIAQNTLERLIHENTDARVGVPTLPLANYPVFNFGQLPADAQLTATLAPYYLDWLAHRMTSSTVAPCATTWALKPTDPPMLPGPSSIYLSKSAATPASAATSETSTSVPTPSKTVTPMSSSTGMTSSSRASGTNLLRTSQSSYS